MDSSGQYKILNFLLLYLFHVVAVFLFCHKDVLIHYIKKEVFKKSNLEKEVIYAM